MSNILGQYHFQGTFRAYQQNILDNAATHMKDRRLHIVAAPGSGKTILGLQLICTYSSPAIVFAPTTTIRNQWGERFTQNFMPDSRGAQDLVSYQLTNIKPLTCVTYQALHAAMNRLDSCRLKDEIDGDTDDTSGADQPAEVVDFSNFDLLAQCNAKGVLTICLDEAHHLKKDWQKALELFLSKLPKDVRIISLTATPPYDSSPEEWKRYIESCGEIDDEIFVPQLVKQHTLCPHQDYVYFCYPSEEERKFVIERRERTKEALDAIVHCDSFKSFIQDILRGLRSQNDFTDYIYDHSKQMAVFLSLADQNDTVISPKIFEQLIGKKTAPSLQGNALDKAFALFLEKDSELDTYRDEIKKILSGYEMIEKRHVCLSIDDQTKRMLISSYGKMNSIKEIAKHEYNDLGNGLQMLILTDYIRKNLTPLIGTDQTSSLIGTVSVFEELRRVMPYESGIGVLSGSLVILPESAIEAAKRLADEYDTQVTFTPYPNTKHYEAVIRGGNKTKVKLVSQLFEEGYLHILIGTKSLLGEGWDSPCINTLILASFVGSFVLSNQMRGRAIRMDRNHPEKVANIWHLVTVEPPEFFTQNAKDKSKSKIRNASDELISSDYEMLKRRFDCFMGPAYTAEIIESGINRIDIIKPPFDEEGIEKINQTMLAYSKNRKKVASSWEYVAASSDCSVVESVEAPQSFLPQSIRFKNKLLFLSMVVLIFIVCVLWAGSGIGIFKIAGSLSLPLIMVVSVVFIGIIGALLLKLPKYLHRLSTKGFLQTLAKAVLNTLTKTQNIGVYGNVAVDSNRLGAIQISVPNISIRDQRIFAEAMEELLTPMKEPRYIIVQNSSLFKYRPYYSFSCPSIIGKKQEWANILERQLLRNSGKFSVIYTRNEGGRELFFRCRRKSFIAMNDKMISHAQRVR
jgi:superfamily II DNA or RNA helicase